jgi:hypothetical protein
MDDFGFLAFADVVIRYFTDRFGTLAGWIAALVVLLALPAAAIWILVASIV